MDGYFQLSVCHLEISGRRAKKSYCGRTPYCEPVLTIYSCYSSQFLLYLISEGSNLVRLQTNCLSQISEKLVIIRWITL